MENVLQKALQFLRDGRGGAIATVLESEGSTPAKAGAKIFVADDGSITGTVGGGALEHLVIRDCLILIEAGGVQLKDYSLDPENGNTGMWCGGKCRIMMEALAPPFRAHVMGAGHIALPLTNILNMAGFRVNVIDDREDLLCSERFPHAQLHHVGDYPGYFQGKTLNSRDSIIVVTRSHAIDLECVDGALRTQAGYIGMIGSSGKIAKIRDALAGRGFSDDDINRIHAPVGLAIGAVSPPEIAVSISAEVIAWRRGLNSVRDDVSL